MYEDFILREKVNSTLHDEETWRFSAKDMKNWERITTRGTKWRERFLKYVLLGVVIFLSMTSPVAMPENQAMYFSFVISLMCLMTDAFTDSLQYHVEKLKKWVSTKQKEKKDAHDNSDRGS